MVFRTSTRRRSLGTLMFAALAVLAGCDANPLDPLADSTTESAQDGSRSSAGPDSSETAPGTAATSRGLHFADNFESGARTNANGFSWNSAGSNVTVSSEQAYSGRYSLRFRFGPDEYGAASSAEQRFAITPNGASAPREVWVEYMLRVPSNFAHRNSTGPDNNKLAAFWAESYEAKAGETLVDIEFERGQALSSFLRIASAKAEGYEHRNPDAVQLAAGTLFDESMRAKWVRIRMHLKSAPGASVVDVWRDDTLIGRLPANYSIADPAWSRDYIRNGYLLGWSNSGFDEQTDFYVDDFKVHTSDPGW